MFGEYDDLMLASSQGYVLDYVAWGCGAGDDDDLAYSYNHWPEGVFINSTDLTANQTMGRNKNSTETNSTSDWENPTTNKADPYGIHAFDQTQGAINLDSQIVINEVMYKNASYNNWTYRKKITIDSSMTSNDYRKKITIDSSMTSNDLINFPVLINITDSDLANNALPNGYDIKFTASDGETQFNHEIERYIPVNGELLAWVNVTSLSSSSDTEIYMYYGNPDSGDQSNPEGVWDDFYAGIWHMSEMNETAYDSTSNNVDGTPMGDISRSSLGKIGFGDEFYGSTNYLELPDDLSIIQGVSAVTLQAWVNLTELPSVEYDIISFSINSGSPTVNSRACLDITSTDEVEVGGRAPDSQPSIQQKVTTTSPMSAGDWYHIVGVIDYANDNIIIYVNGQSQTTSGTIDFTQSTTDNTVTSYSTIGSEDDASKDDMKGKLDEVRVSTAIRNSSWIEAEYNNQFNTNTFISVGSEEATGATAYHGYEWVEIYNKGDTAVDLAGWYLTDNDGNTFYLTGAGSISADSYIVAHLGESGTNSSTDVYGEISGPSTTQSITIQPGPSNGKDVGLDQSAPNDRNGEDSYIEVEDYNPDKLNGLLEFNMSFIPDGVTIQEAKLWLYRFTGSGSGQGHANIRRITRNWTELYSDWNNYDSGNNWVTAGGDYHTKVYDWKTILITVNRWYDWNVTELISEWKDGTYTNYGLALETHWSSSWHQFRTSDYYTDLKLRPKLIVNYTVPSTLTLSMLDYNDDLSLCDSNGEIIDYIAWGADAGSDDDSATTRGLWTAGSYIDTSTLLENQTIGRDKDSTDNDTVENWENSTTNKADPFGVNATDETPRAQNLSVIPEYGDATFTLIVIAVTAIFIAFRKEKEKGIKRRPDTRG
jgi:hypothetical protein